VYVLTGAPLASRPSALFPLLQLAGHTLGRSYATFARRYGTGNDRAHAGAGGGVANFEELTRQLGGVMLRRSRDEILSLPPKLRTWLSVDVPCGIGVREVRAMVRLLFESRLGLSPWYRELRRSADGSRTDRIRLMAELTTARQKLAIAKVPFTIDLVQGAVDQGEKLLVFSCFAEPVQEIQAHFGDAAVLLTGSTPAGKRQQIVERFQTDPSVRVFVASPVGGGLRVTAARQIVFNDLDWLPANHWQAEEQASRLSRTGTVNVSYLVGAGTIDEFVQRVLEARAALLNAAPDFESVAVEAGADLLGELERAIGLLSPELAGNPPVADPEAHLLRQVAALPGPSREALLGLAEMLSATSDQRYRAENLAAPGGFETVDVDATGTVTCSCTGYESVGACDHARRLLDWVITGGSLPEGFSPE
jgi:SWI/SNF-related matrix-associated actin-dependent regulator 1 of chromatin subfamily A